jgi:outer membrane protein assembly factor BamB
MKLLELFLFLALIYSTLLSSSASFFLRASVQEDQTVHAWPMLGHDLAHSCYSESPAPDMLQLIWRHNTESYVTSSPVVFEGRVYVGSRLELHWEPKQEGHLKTPAVYCLDAETGKKIWNYETEGDVVSTAHVINGRLYIGSFDKYIYCLDADTGERLWRYLTGGKIDWACPAVINGKVYIGSWDHYFYCLNAETGKVIWRYELGNMTETAPAVVGGKVYIGALDGYTYCIDAENGGLKWKQWTSDVSASSTVFVDGKVYISVVGNLDVYPDVGNMYVCCLDGETGELIRKYEGGGCSSPAVAYGRLYVGAHDGYFRCFDVETGVEIWNYKTGNIIASSPAVADGKVYIGSKDGYLYCFDAERGEVICKYKTEGAILSSPAVVDGKVYVGSDDGYIYCLGHASNSSVSQLVLYLAVLAIVVSVGISAAYYRCVRKKSKIAR